MAKKLLTYFFLSTLGIVTPSFSEVEALHPKKVDWPFSKKFTGTYDKAAVQRGLQVYRQVCSSCHSLSLVRFGDLASGKAAAMPSLHGVTKGIGLTDEETKTLAAEYQVDDINEDGQPIKRKATLTDHFPAPYLNEKQARASNGGALPPDQSLLVKARHDGANYIYSLLTGYGHPPPAEVHVGEGQYWNPYFPGGLISMAPPLTEGAVTYADGTVATVEQMAKDITSFLAWTAEPEMEHRKSLGIKVIWYLAFLSLLFFLAYRKVWKNVH